MPTCRVPLRPRVSSECVGGGPGVGGGGCADLDGPALPADKPGSCRRLCCQRRGPQPSDQGRLPSHGCAATGDDVVLSMALTMVLTSELESWFRPKTPSPVKFHAAGNRFGWTHSRCAPGRQLDARAILALATAAIGMLQGPAPGLRSADFPKICCRGDNLSFPWSRSGQLSSRVARIQLGFCGFATRSPSIATQVDSHAIGTSPPSRIPPILS